MLSYLWRDVILLTECFSRWCFLLQQKAVIIPELFKNSNTEKQDKWSPEKFYQFPYLLPRLSTTHGPHSVTSTNRSDLPHPIWSPPDPRKPLAPLFKWFTPPVSRVCLRIIGSIAHSDAWSLHSDIWTTHYKQWRKENRASSGSVYKNKLKYGEGHLVPKVQGYREIYSRTFGEKLSFSKDS